MSLRKNQVGRIQFYAYDDNDDSPSPGDAGNITVNISKDGGGNNPATNSVTEIDATNMSGWYQVILTAEELNADIVVATPMVSGMTATTPRSDPDSIMIYTDVDYENDILGSGFSTSTDSLEAIRDDMGDAATAITRDD